VYIVDAPDMGGKDNPLCKIFCMTDEMAYASLTRHVKFIRHSDMSESDVCHDEVIRIRENGLLE
jgi:hypothetical protein